jgi:hypothetical protein
MVVWLSKQRAKAPSKDQQLWVLVITTNRLSSHLLSPPLLDTSNQGPVFRIPAVTILSP